MTEREKMLAGELYDCGDAELLHRWHEAKDMARNYNSLASGDMEGRNLPLQLSDCSVLRGWLCAVGVPLDRHFA